MTIMPTVASPKRSMAVGSRAFFVDTAYLNALVNLRDQWHGVAVEWQRKLAATRHPLVTTEFILVEFADGLASVRFRDRAVASIGALRMSSSLEIIPASATLFDDALNLFQRRPDKDWGMTDCASFIVMGEQRIDAALTTDEHFRQAGFRPLLLEATPS